MVTGLALSLIYDLVNVCSNHPWHNKPLQWLYTTPIRLLCLESGCRLVKSKFQVCPKKAANVNWMQFLLNQYSFHTFQGSAMEAVVKKIATCPLGAQVYNGSSRVLKDDIASSKS